MPNVKTFMDNTDKEQIEQSLQKISEDNPVKVINLESNRVNMWEYESGLYYFISSIPEFTMFYGKKGVGEDVTESISIVVQCQKIFAWINKKEASNGNITWDITVFTPSSAARSFRVHYTNSTQKWSTINNAFIPQPSSFDGDPTGKGIVVDEFGMYDVADIVRSVNGKTGVISLTAEDVGAATVEYVDSAKSHITLKDEINGYDYIVVMHNGSLISYCKADSISVTTMPNKVDYSAGEALDLTGMVVTLTRQDGTTEEILDHTVPNELPSDGIIEISYTEAGEVYSTSITVNISEASTTE